MKNIILTVFALISACASAQVAIGKDNVTNTSVSLEFGAGNRGMILPWVTAENNVTGAVPGTIIYDTAVHKVKVLYAAGWKDLSVDTTGTTVDPGSLVDGITIQNFRSDITPQTALPELTNAKVSIGTPTATPGILVLEDNNKAMILPLVASPHQNIINPAPGMSVYDTTKNQLAVFNGKVWSFWKP